MESHEAASHSFTHIRKLLDQSRKAGPRQHPALMFVAALMNALAETTAEFVAREPANADEHCKAGFEPMWRMIA